VRGTPRPAPYPTAAAAAAAAAATAPVAPEGEFGKQSAATAEQQGNRPSQQAKAERAELLAEEAANKRPIGTVSQYGCGDTLGAQQRHWHS